MPQQQYPYLHNTNMHVIPCVVFVLFSGFVTVFGDDLPDRACKSIRPKLDLNETRFEGEWIVYGGNIKCNGCCITYDLDVTRPGFVISRNTNYTLLGPKKTFETTGTIISPGVYRMKNVDTIYILDTDYVSYFVAYRQPGRFVVYIRSLDVLKDIRTRTKVIAAFNRQSKICGVKYYPYMVELACRRYKPKPKPTPKPTRKPTDKTTRKPKPIKG